MATSESERLKTCESMANDIRRWIIEQSLASNVGHVGSALSITDIVAALWNGVLRNPGTDMPERDRFILSKGHAALALYGALRWRGLLSEATFRTFCANGSLLGVHPEQALPGVDLSTGSLGQGLSVGCGLAYAFRLKQLGSRVFVLLSDAECNEGQVWEAAQFAGHHKQSNLCAIIDLNGLQALGFTREIINIGSMHALWTELGWESVETDGHNIENLLAAFDAPLCGKPRIIIAKTCMGKRVSFMEDKLEWHYRNLTPELAQCALQELEGCK